MPKDRLLIAKILKTVGVKGELKLHLLTDFPERFKEGFICLAHSSEILEEEEIITASIKFLQSNSAFKGERSSYSKVEKNLKISNRALNSLAEILGPELMDKLSQRLNSSDNSDVFKNINTNLPGLSLKAKSTEFEAVIVKVQDVKVLSNGQLKIKFWGIDDMESAAKMRNVFLSLDPSHAKKLPEGRWYERDLLNLEVFDLHQFSNGQGSIESSDKLGKHGSMDMSDSLENLEVLESFESFESLGRIKEILHYPASDILVVEKKFQVDILVPFVDDLIYKVDLVSGKVILNFPDGLIELYRGENT